MKLVIFGLTISSSWGNGHATVLRGLLSSLHRRGHDIVFFEKDVPYYAAHRDCDTPDWARLYLYPDWETILPRVRKQLADADIGMVTSYCADGRAAADEVIASSAWLRIFYDLDTPVTLQNLGKGLDVPYIGPRGLRDFDLALSFTGGTALTELRRTLGAPRAAPLYGSVDPDAHYPVAPRDAYRADCSYLGTFAADRQDTLDAFLVGTARKCPGKKFLIGGSLYPPDFPREKNIRYIRHVPPSEHPAFYSSSAFTLNVTRGAMARMGYCPSGRLFEAASCAATVISDFWEGIDRFYQPGSEIVIARTGGDVCAAMAMPEAERKAIAARARQRTFDEHTAAHRAREFEKIVSEAASAGTRET